MASPSVIIIGAGVAGLSAGCYAQLAGFQSKIIEMGHRAGGVCQSWQRGEYTINGCVHWLVGSSPHSFFYRTWEDLGVAADLKTLDHAYFGRYEFAGYPPVLLYTDIDRLERHLLELAPADAKRIRAMTRAVRVFSRYELSPLDEKRGLAAFIDQVRMVFGKFPMLREVFRWWGMSLRDFGDKFHHPALRSLFANFWHPDMSVLMLLGTLAFANQKNAGYPLGGSSRLAESIERRYRELGGSIRFGAPAERILVENGRARGVRFLDGTEEYADFVLSAADGHATIFSLLEGRFVDERIRRVYRELQPFPALTFAALGVADPLEEIPASTAGVEFPLNPPIQIGNCSWERLACQVYNFDPALAPAGKSVLTFLLDADYDYWTELAKDPAAYEAEKKRAIEQLIAGVEQRFPGISAKIEMTDLATPVTFQRYTGNYRGSYEGWLPTTAALRTNVPKTLPGLTHFFMAGHWVEPGGGLPTAAMSGKNAVRAMCRAAGREFRIG